MGEIFISENGEYLIRDGIDDFTMVAIDADGNGVLDELDNRLIDDIGTIGGSSLGDVHVLDDDWANLDGSDQAAGTESLNLVLADPSPWDLANLALGQITFGTVGPTCNPNSQGDLEGNGSVEFADFLVLSANFGQTVGRAQAVPEPSASLLAFAGLLIGFALRRRRS